MSKKCAFCDERRIKNGRIPACKNPAVKEISIVLLGQPKILSVCLRHYRLNKEGWPVPGGKLIPVSKTIKERIVSAQIAAKHFLPYFHVREVKEYVCKGCGDVIIRTSPDYIFGGELNGMDLLVMEGHLNTCKWRRKRLNKDKRVKHRSHRRKK